MSRRVFLATLSALLVGMACLPAQTKPSGGVPADAITWKKTIIEHKFRSEGVAVADVNKDGKLDILVGDLWYEAPDWKPHAIRKIMTLNDPQHQYSECMCCWAEDVNRDGWPDQISIGFPGKPAFWYENPQGRDEPWKEHVIWHSACNETPLFVDLFGNGKRVLVMGFQPKEPPADKNLNGRMGQMAWFTPDKDPNAPWVMHPISVPSEPGKEMPGTQQFSHGLGATDVNGDGRLDVVCTGGWWEQPEKAGDEPWKFHPAALGEACADMFAYDVDGDGKNDVISSSAHKFGIWWHQYRGEKDGHPQFIKQELFKDLVSETHAMHLVDINGDGRKDLVTGKRFWSHGRNEPGSEMPARLYWFENQRGSDGMTKFIPHVIDEDSGIGTQFMVTDFNGDGLLDIVVSNKKGVFLFEQQRNSTALKDGR